MPQDVFTLRMAIQESILPLLIGSVQCTEAQGLRRGSQPGTLRKACRDGAQQIRSLEGNFERTVHKRLRCRVQVRPFVVQEAEGPLLLMGC